jgi:cyclohexadieny/prephenate dehydrogenase
MIGRFSEDLSVLQKAVRWEDGKTLFQLFSKTRKIRDKIVMSGQDTDAPDFGRSKKIK